MKFRSLQKIAKDKGLSLCVHRGIPDPYTIWSREEYKAAKRRCFRVHAHTLEEAEELINLWA